jgi:hypothetical protein
VRLVRFEEAARRIETALGIAAPESVDEMALNLALAYVAMELPEKAVSAVAASQRASELAVRLQSPASEFKATWAIWQAQTARGRVDLAYPSAVRLRELVSDGPTSPEGLIAEHVSGVTEFLRGNVANARAAIERLHASSKAWHQRQRLRWHEYDPSVGAGNSLVPLLWLAGKPDSAVAIAHETAARALSAGNDNATPGVLADGACLMAVMVGDESGAERYLELLDASLRRGGSPGFASWAQLVRALLAARRGDAGPGLALLGAGFDVRVAHPRRVPLLAELAENLGYAGVTAPATQLADTLLERVQHGGETWMLGEIQRVRAQLCTDDGEAQSLLSFALETARRQGALAWELRGATNLARRWPTVGRPPLAAALENYTEGHWTRDVVAAREALTTP